MNITEALQASTRPPRGKEYAPVPVSPERVAAKLPKESPASIAPSAKLLWR